MHYTSLHLHSCSSYSNKPVLSIVTQDASDLPAPSPDLDLDPGSYCCALHITMDEESLKRRSNDIRYEEEQKFSAFSTSLCQPGCYLLDSRHNSYTLALLSGSKLELITLRKILIDSVRKIFPYDGQNCDVIIASGNLCHNLNRLNESIKSVAEALKLHFIKGTNSDIFYEEVVSYIGKEADPSPKLPLSGTTLISLIKKQDKKGLERELLQLKENLRQCGRESYLYMTFSISRLYTDLASELGSSGIELQDVFDDPMEEFKKVASSTTLEESIENLKQNLFKIVDSLNARKSKYGKQVEQAIDHIKHHYSESNRRSYLCKRFGSLPVSVCCPVLILQLPGQIHPSSHPELQEHKLPQCLLSSAEHFLLPAGKYFHRRI